MGIDVSRLSPAAQRQILGKVLDAEKRRKYGNTTAIRMMPNGKQRKFDSQREARRYDELVMMLQAGRIRDLRLQQTFTLQEGYVSVSGETVRPITYKADFVYTLADGRRVIEDVKGVRTKEYRIKCKLMMERGYTIREI